MVETILLVLLLSPAVLVWLLRADGALTFLSLAAGATISNYANADITRLLGGLSTNSSLVNLAVVFLPAAITLVLTHRSVLHSKRILHLIPALACGGLLALAAVPLLTSSVTGNFYSLSLWSDLQKYQSEIVGVGGGVSLLLVWGHAAGKHGKKSKS